MVAGLGPPVVADIVNLRLARKAKARLTAQKLAEANRAKHGRTKGEVAAEKADAERLQRHLDETRREKD